MTEVYIIKIEEGAKYNNIIYDYWITCKLSNENEIKLFNWNILTNIHEFLNKKAMIKITALFVQTEPDKRLHHFFGKIIFADNNYLFTNDFIEIQITENIIIENNLQFSLNHNKVYYFGRLDIIEITKKNEN